MRKILVPTDFSTTAYGALMYVTQLFQKEKSCFYLLNSFESEMSMTTSRVDIGKREQVYDKLLEDSKTKLNELRQSIINDTESFDHCFECISSSVLLSREINNIVKKKEIELVVMGTNGVTGTSEIFLGSNSLQVIRKIKESPLLVVPQDFNFTPPKRMLFPTDFKNNYNTLVSNTIISIVSLFKSKLDILHIREDLSLEETQKRHLKILKVRLESIENEVYWVSKDSKKTQIINRFIEEYQVDLLLMLFNKKNLLMRLIREPVIKKKVLNLSIPFLVIPTTG